MELSMSINLGVLECWSVGVMVKGLISIFSILHYSRSEISGIIKTAYIKRDANYG